MSAGGLSNAWNNFSAHPFVNSGIALGSVISPIPGTGFALHGLANHIYNNQFNNAANASMANLQQQGNQAQTDAMNQPLGGRLGQFGQSPSMNGNTWNMGQQFGQQPQSPGLLDFLGQQQQQQPQGSFFSDPRYAPQQGNNQSYDGSSGMSGNNYGGNFTMASGNQLPGGGFSDFMNGASSSMMANFAAPTGGDWGGIRLSGDPHHHTATVAPN